MVSEFPVPGRTCVNVESPVLDGCGGTHCLSTRETEAEGDQFQDSLGYRVKSCLEKNWGGIGREGEIGNRK